MTYLAYQLSKDYSYLFYEGEIDYKSNATANVTPLVNYNQYIVKNSEKYSLSNLYFIYGYNNFLSPENNFLNICSFGQMIPGAIELTFDSRFDKLKTVAQTKEELIDELISRNLTEDAANDFISYWRDWWFNPTNNGYFTRIIYFIPERVYDELLPIRFSPEPKYIDRVGIITITDVPIINDYNGITMWVTSMIKLGTSSFLYFIDGDTIDISDVDIIIKNPNPNNDTDLLTTHENNTFTDITDGRIKWVDKNDDGLMGDNDEIMVYKYGGFILGEWKITLIQRSTSRILLYTTIEINNTQ